MTAVHHANQKDVWLLAHEGNNNIFRAYLITETGISFQPIISPIGEVHNFQSLNDVEGQMKLSPDGKKLAVVLSGSRIVQLFDFNSSTGSLENSYRIPYSAQNLGFYGLEFSPTSTFFYFTNTALTCSSGFNNKTSILQVQTGNPNQEPFVIGLGKPDENIGALQLAPDGRIYVASCKGAFFPSGHSFLGVINYPDRLGPACNFNDMGIPLTIGKVNVQGLPNFIQSYFLFDDPVVEMPNIFTPNETDTINARFTPIRLENINYASLTIVNRWGQQVFYTENLETGWDGGGQPDGVYYWSMQYDGKNGKSGAMRGWVNILR